jgi:hypothetical protein
MYPSQKSTRAKLLEWLWHTLTHTFFTKTTYGTKCTNVVRTDLDLRLFSPLRLPLCIFVFACPGADMPQPHRTLQGLAVLHPL